MPYLNTKHQIHVKLAPDTPKSKNRWLILFTENEDNKIKHLIFLFIKYTRNTAVNFSIEPLKHLLFPKYFREYTLYHFSIMILYFREKNYNFPIKRF